jgi:signal peptidase I
MVRTFVWLVAIATSLASLSYLFVFDVPAVPAQDARLTASIEPLLRPFDRVVTRRKAVPHTGDLARCALPKAPGAFAIARVFGVEGQTVEVLNERVAVDGRAPVARGDCGTVTVAHPATKQPVTLSCSVEEAEGSTYRVLTHPSVRPGHTRVKVESGFVFLVSDDRHLHLDSRDFGPLEAALCEPIVWHLRVPSVRELSAHLNFTQW